MGVKGSLKFQTMLHKSNSRAAGWGPGFAAESPLPPNTNIPPPTGYSSMYYWKRGGGARVALSDAWR